MIESERTLIVGTGALARALMVELVKTESGVPPNVGIVTEPGRQVCLPLPFPIVGSMERLREIVLVFRPDLVIIATESGLIEQFVEQLVDSSISRRIRVESAETVYEKLTGKLAIEALTPHSLIASAAFEPSRGTRWFARTLSLLCASAGLVIVAPFLAMIALAIKLNSRGPVFFIQDRIGFRGEIFNLVKFRTMRPVSGPRSEWVKDNEDRITRVGAFLRRFRLDELPQLINVIRGDMNLVGPRPHPASNFELFMLVSRNMPLRGGQVPYYSLRLRVPPGITGWAQVRYQYANDVDEEIEKLRFDLYYLKYASVRLDLRILFETVAVVLLGRSASENAVHSAPSGPSPTATDTARSLAELAAPRPR